MFKIVEDGEKFKIKEVDDSGNTIRLLEEEFDTHNDATDFIKEEEGEDVHGPSDPQSGTKKCLHTDCGVDLAEAGPDYCEEHTVVAMKLYKVLAEDGIEWNGEHLDKDAEFEADPESSEFEFAEGEVEEVPSE